MKAPLDVRRAVDANSLWYHTLDLGSGVETPGWFDLRPIIERLPWPDVRGKRCLDVGTADGFFAFELERRGAAEVVATDLSDHRLWDWPPHLRENGIAFLNEVVGQEKGMGLRVARDCLGSSIEVVNVSAYDLSPDTVGEFDVVVCGSLLLHLRDPSAALGAIHSVCTGQFLSMNQIDLSLTVSRRQSPMARLHSLSDKCQWWVINPEAHRQMLTTVGFTPVKDRRPYAIPYGHAHPGGGRTVRGRIGSSFRRVYLGNDGVPHHAILAEP